MKKIDIRNLIITCIVCLLPIFLGISFYNELPEKVAIHFDINNNPNSFFNKNVFVFGIPVMMMLFQLFVCVIIGLSDKDKEANKKMSSVLKWIIPILTIMLYITTLGYALNFDLDIRKIVMVILGVMYIIMGNYIPKTKGENYMHFSFIKNKNIPEKEIEKIKRILGYIFIINGIMFIISTFFTPTISVILVCLLIIEVICTDVYAYSRAKKGE